MRGNAASHLCCRQEVEDNEKHLSDAKVRENPDADWNTPRFIAIDVKPSLHSLQCV